MQLTLSTPVRFLKLVGERIGATLAERGVETVEDLLYHLPFRYEDRLRPRPLSDYRAGDMASITGEVRSSILLRTRSKPIFELVVAVKPAGEREDQYGVLDQPPLPETVKCIWFNGTYLQGKFHAGQMVALYGKLEVSRSGNAAHAAPNASRYKIIQPTFEILPDAGATGDDAEFTLLEMGRIVPVYPSLGGTTAWGSKLGSRWLRRVLFNVFRDLERVREERLARGELEEDTDAAIPEALRSRLGMPSRMQALRELHFPAAGTDLNDLQGARTPAHRRLIFEELWYLELGLELKRRRLRERAGTAFETNDRVRAALKQVLPFKPTGAQKRVLGEIVSDMRSPQPMRRLLQGDVGSGKTIVALEAALVAIENGYQVALMAPTEILATQHYLSARKLLAEHRSPTHDRPYKVTLLTGSLDLRGKREARGRIFRGETDLAVGTHALVEEKVDFSNLGLVIVDEQHRFGVQQRYRLMRKPGPDGIAHEPDVLVMTATPIPRTLALTIYGDLETSILDELPPGRTPIATRRMPAQRADEVWSFIRREVEAGRQAYVVCPIIEGDKEDQPELDFAAAAEPEPVVLEKPKRTKKAEQASLEGIAATAPRRRAPANRQKLRSAVEVFEELGAGPLAGLKIGLLHGRMSADDKEVTMARFKRNEIQVLVSTTVIEVGVDVPNATVMVIEHAERFGLAQMHQLRGRVGRGAQRSACVLLTGEQISAEAEARLDAMVATQDGFALAEFDLKQRGPGEFFGTRQAGLPEFRLADLTRDREVLELAKIEAERFVEARDPAITTPEREAVWARLKRQWQRRYGLVEA